MLGAGVQALARVRPIQRVLVWAREAARADAYTDEMTRRLDLDAVPIDSVERLVLESDVVVARPARGIDVLVVSNLSNINYPSGYDGWSFYGLPPSDALAVVTSNVADATGLARTGRIAAGMDADLVAFDADWQIDTVLARRQVMVEAGEPLVRGMFDRIILDQPG